jgi:hypothetical protein
MLHPGIHPSDQTLLLGLDRELSTRRQLALDRHLANCERCLARSSTLASVASETSRLCFRDETATTSTELLRRRLQADMSELGARWDRSVWFHLRKALATLPLAIRFGASVALIVVVLSLVRSARGTIPTATIDPASLPIRTVTPGATVRVDRDAVCDGRLPPRSAIPVSIRQAILRQYRMENVSEDEYELDYLITPELGGATDPRNLWPQRYASGEWNASIKDDLERVLPELVCQGRIDLATAQQEIAENWIAAYRKYFNTERPLARQAARRVGDDDRQNEQADSITMRASAFPSDVQSRRDSWTEFRRQQ